MTWDPMAAWEAAKDAGMLVQVSAMLAGAAVPVDFFAKWHSPDEEMGARTSSRQYSIEYVHADCPGLAEADQVLIDVMYRVREAPYIPEVKDRGEFRRALLTRVVD
jgi:hypothetical protein